MALPSSGSLSMSQVNTEIGRSSSANISLGETNVRALARVSSGTISMQDLRGKAFLFTFSITSNQTSANLRTLAVNAGWDQVLPVRATINSGVTITGSTANNSTPALHINGSWPNGVTLINNGLIIGRGGNGGNGGGFTSDTNITSAGNGVGGGRALRVDVPASINNQGTIAGGGGGGGGGQGLRVFTEPSSKSPGSLFPRGGGGGGGGRSSLSGSSGGSGGAAVTSSGGTGFTGVAGGNGSLSSAGSGGGGGASGGNSAGTGGNGGNRGAAGGRGGAANPRVSLVDSTTNRGNGGAAGQAVLGNSNITWISTGTRLGPIAS